MSLQGLLTNLFLPPLLLALIGLVAGLFAWRRSHGAGATAALCALGLLLLATPFAADTLTAALEEHMEASLPAGLPIPAAIVVLGGEMAHSSAGPEVGPLTLERLRAAAMLHRQTGLPLPVTGGSLSRERRQSPR